MPQHDPERPPARWTLSDSPNLAWLRGRAKQLRDRHAAGDADALELVSTYDPGDGPVSLGRAQRVLARAFGFAGWSRLRAHLATVAELSRPMDETSTDDDPVEAFLRLACLDYATTPSPERARRLLGADPSLATASAAAMAVCGRADDLSELLDQHPEAALDDDGPHRWPPLLYLCFGRLGVGDPVATLRVLLEAGADPNSGFLWRGLASPFTALTGVLGGGERGEPPHPQARELAELLLEAGADPNDNQAFYNRMFSPDDSHLDPLLRHVAGRSRPSPWRDRLGAAYPSPEQMLGEHLRAAAERGFTERVRRLLAHGVDPNTTGYHPVLGDLTAYEVAVRHGHHAAADLLEAAGGRSERLEEIDLLVARAFAGDGDAVEQLRHEDLPARRPDAMRLAAEQHDLAAVRLLVDLGYDVDTHGPERVTALHEAALRGDVQMCEWLVGQGADRGIEDRSHGGTPAGWAAFAGHVDLAERLSP